MKRSEELVVALTGIDDRSCIQIQRIFSCKLNRILSIVGYVQLKSSSLYSSMVRSGLVYPISMMWQVGVAPVNLQMGESSSFVKEIAVEIPVSC